MIAFILAKFINTVGPRSVASNAVKVKLNPQHGIQAGLERHLQSTRMCVTPMTDPRPWLLRVLRSVVNFLMQIEIVAFRIH